MLRALTRSSIDSLLNLRRVNLCECLPFLNRGRVLWFINMLLTFVGFAIEEEAELWIKHLGHRSLLFASSPTVCGC